MIILKPNNINTDHDICILKEVLSLLINEIRHLQDIISLNELDLDFILNSIIVCEFIKIYDEVLRVYPKIIFL